MTRPSEDAIAGAASGRPTKAKQVVIALATLDFDPTEVAVPWATLRAAEAEVRFATADGRPGACDPLMLTGVAFGAIRAERANRERYAEMVATPEFAAPLRFVDLDLRAIDLLVLPGGHAKGMRQYLEDADLQRFVAAFLAAGKNVGSICHGAVVLARAVGPDGRSVLAGRRLASLPRTMELGAWLLTCVTRGDYFRTYDETLQSEVERALGPEGAFLAGPLIPAYGNPFVVRDGHLVSARWPGDAAAFAEALVELLAEG